MFEQLEKIEDLNERNKLLEELQSQKKAYQVLLNRGSSSNDPAQNSSDSSHRDTS